MEKMNNITYKVEEVTLSSLRNLAADKKYDYKDHVYVTLEEAEKIHDCKLLIIDEKYIAITIFYTAYLIVNDIGYKRINENCNGGVSYVGQGQGLSLPDIFINEIIKHYPNYKLNGWDYLHYKDISMSETVKLIPHKYMYRDIVNIIDNIPSK